MSYVLFQILLQIAIETCRTGILDYLQQKKLGTSPALALSETLWQIIIL